MDEDQARLPHDGLVTGDPDDTIDGLDFVIEVQNYLEEERVTSPTDESP